MEPWHENKSWKSLSSISLHEAHLINVSKCQPLKSCAALYMLAYPVLCSRGLSFLSNSQLLCIVLKVRMIP